MKRWPSVRPGSCRAVGVVTVAAIAVWAVAVGSSPAATAAPVIMSVTFGGSTATPTFVIHGRGFGGRPAPSQPPATSSACRQDGASGNHGQNFGSKLFFIDQTNAFSGGLSGPYRGVPNVIDCVGLIVTSYTPSRIVYTLGSDYRKHPYGIHGGDKVMFVVNGAKATLRVRYGATVPNPGT